MNTLNPPALTGGGRMRGPAQDIKGGGLPRAFIIFSIVLHVLAFLFAVGVPRLLSSGPSGNKVYVVDLVSLPGGAEQPAPAPPAAAAPAPEPAKPPPAKAPEVKKPEVKPEPKKPAPKPIVLPDKDALKKKTTKAPEKPPEKKPAEPEPKKDAPKEKEPEPADESGTEESAETATAAAASTPTQTAANAAVKPGGVPGAAPGTGSGAGAGPGTGAGSGDELTFYYALLKRRIEAAWKRPVSTSRETRTAAVYVELSPTGRLLKLELKTPSGYAPFDRSIIQAVKDAEPFPPFPLALKMDRLNPILEFELTPLGGDAQP